ncbi:hypothetical protein Pelo_17132 [Pelomyxa schiedti]|nr:hypothetical protein Pelo_17132 [Pelomyxa schiedti]
MALAGELPYPNLEMVCRFKGCVGLKWLLQHIPAEQIGQREVAQAVGFCLALGNISGVLFLLEKFHIPHGTEHPFPVWKRVCSYLSRFDLKTAQQIASLGEFTQAEVAASLTDLSSVVSSSKTVKWMIENYHVTGDQIKGNTNALLFKLVTKSKTSCAEWLIRKAAITLPEVVDMITTRMELHPRLGVPKVLLSTWKMLLREFPQITADIVRAKLMDLVIASPRHIEHTIHTVTGITQGDAIEHCNKHKSEVLFPPETALWLSMQKSGGDSI